jgi:glutamate-1-semialdehyde 2,1-aminomutase
VLRRLRDPSVYEEIEALAARLETGLAPFGTVQRVGGMLTVFCREGVVRDHEDARASDTERFGALFRHLLGAGVYVPPSQFECLFPSTAHTEADVEQTVAAVEAFAASH